jgi:predicted ATPase/DNA-binding CsgD family transcriptional regulator
MANQQGVVIMTQRQLMHELITLAKTHLPKTDFDFLTSSIFTDSLTQKEEQNLLQLIEFTRVQQTENPTFEAVYQQLLYLYVLNGSRLASLKTIDRRLKGLMEGQCAVLLISGVSGIGKTSTVMAFQERIKQLGVEFIVVRCSEQESSSYAAWQDVAQLLSNKGISIETLSAPIGTGPQAHSSQQLRQSLTHWLKECTNKSPLVILFDDLHWADTDSLEMLYQQTNQSSTIPILFIATYRSEEIQQSHPLQAYLPKLRRNGQVDLIHLQALNSDDIKRLVTAYHGPCSDELTDYLLKRAEGHPLFTVELLHDLISRNLLTRGSAGYWLPPEQSVQVPAFLKQLIQQRVASAGNEAEHLLTVAAVAGESWHLKIIEPMVELSEEKLLTALETALKIDLIVIENDKEEVYRFSHGLVREVLYTGQLARQRKQIHERIAIQFEQQQQNNIYAIAHHFYEAENWEEAVHFCLAAGEQAVQRFAFLSALSWYQQALNAAEHAGKALTSIIHISIYDRLGRTHRALEQRQEAEIIYSRMRDVAQNSGNLVAEGHALVNLASIRINQYQFDLAEKTALEALKIGEQTSDAQLLAHIHSCLGILLIYRGQLDRSAHHLSEAQSHTQRLDDLAIKSEVFKHLSYLAIWTGQYHEAEIHSHNSLESAQKSIDPLAKVSGYQNLSWTQIESGKYHEAYQNIIAIVEPGARLDTHHHNLPRLLNLMGYLYLELGDAQQALMWDQRALAASWITQAQGNYEMRRYSLLNIATDYVHLGKLNEALEAIAQFESIKEASQSVRFRYFNRYQLLMSEMYLAQGSYEQSLEFAQEARKLAEANKISKNIAKSYWFEGQALAGMLRLDKAIEHLEKAGKIVDGIEHGSLRWKIRLSLAKVMRMAGQSADVAIQQSRDLIDQTLQSLSGSPLQASFLASTWFKQLEELEKSPAADSQLYPAGLTQREVEVLRLVATGASNQQIADELHISVRTVNTHMTNILNKTNCENRTAASAFAIQHNLVSR